MIDHFRFVASIYDRLIGVPDLDRLKRVLCLPVEGWMLDMGGGTGRVTSPLRSLVGNVVVGDLSMAMLRQSQIKNSLYPVRMYAEQLPFFNETFTRILIVDALHHFLDQQQAIGELLRVLKPGGILAIEEPDINLPAVKFVALAEKIVLMKSRFQSSKEIVNMIKTFGVSAKVVEQGHFRIWVRAVK